MSEETSKSESMIKEIIERSKLETHYQLPPEIKETEDCKIDVEQSLNRQLQSLVFDTCSRIKTKGEKLPWGSRTTKTIHVFSEESLKLYKDAVVKHTVNEFIDSIEGGEVELTIDGSKKSAAYLMATMKESFTKDADNG